MITLAQTLTTPRPRLLVRLQNHLHRLTAAYARQARFSGLDPSAPHDTGLPPEVVLGEPAYDPALPFFLQSGFQGRD